MKWEYKYFQIESWYTDSDSNDGPLPKAVVAQIKNLGEAGWELTSTLFYNYGAPAVLIFKRPKN